MRRASLVLALVLAPALAAAYPLYWIGTQVRGRNVSWQYSGLGSNNQPWSGNNAPADKVKAAIAQTFVSFAQGNAKDAAGNACSYLAFTDTTPEAGTTDRLEQEGRWTEGIFVSQRTDPIYQYMRGGVVAFALPTPDEDGYVADCDTVYNAVDVPFSTGTQGLSLQGIAMQETAHCFGLHHVCQQSPGDGQPPCNGADVDTTSVMFPFADPNFGADEPDGRDQDNMCQIYPVNGIGRPCDPRHSGPDGQPVGFAVSDCLAGTACTCTEVGQICTQACSEAAPCPAGSRCSSGSCVPDFYPSTEHTGVATRTGFGCDTGNVLHKPIGAACEADVDCGQGETCLKGPTGGYCSVNCESANCPADGTCVTDVVKPGDAWCLRPCTFNANTCAATGCREGHVCQYLGAGTHGVCFDGCEADKDCDTANPPASVCDTTTGMCHPKRVSPVCGPHKDDPVPPACVATCAGVTCGETDGCGLYCEEGSGCTPPAAPDAGTPAPVATPEGGCGCGAVDLSAFALLGLVFRRRRARFLAGIAVIGLAVLATTGCSPPVEPASPDAGTPAFVLTNANFRGELADAYCDYARRCAPALAHVYCEPPSAGLTTELAAGRVGFDVGTAEACLDAVRESPCEADPFLAAPLAASATCDAATPPALDDGASCFDDRDCKGGWCDTSSCPGKCAKAAAAGASCANAKCAEGSYCSRRSNNTCVALSKNGDACNFDRTCASGYCKVDLRTGRAACAEPKGANAAKEGANCASYDDCAAGLYCHFDPTTLDGTQFPVGKCRAQVAPGLTCGTDGDFYGVTNACAKGLACAGYSVPETTSLHNPQLPGACVAWADVGEACTPPRAGAAFAITGCLYGLVCGKDAKCALPTMGAACGVDSYSGCVSGEACDQRQGKCVPFGGEGDRCSFPNDCQSGSCVGGRCSPVCKAG